MKWWKTRIYRDSVCTISNNRNMPKQWKHWMKQMRVNKYDSEYRRTHYGKTHFVVEIDYSVSTDLENFNVQSHWSTLIVGVIAWDIHTLYPANRTRV